MIKVVFFARLREELGTGTTEIPADNIERISDVVGCLTNVYGTTWHSILTTENVLVAINQTMVKGDHRVADGDEVAFFPPVTGG